MDGEFDYDCTYDFDFDFNLDMDTELCKVCFIRMIPISKIKPKVRRRLHRARRR
jgi:hypothetical protein